MKKTKDLITNKGITLIALVITIIVMLILVAVTISMAVNGGLFNYAGKAVGETKNAIENESEGYDKYVQDMLVKYGVEDAPVTNPYEADGWEYAWTYTDGVWSEMLTKGQVAEGDVVAKFYKTGNKVPVNEEIGLPEGDEYHLIIEGQGDMGDLYIIDDESGDEEIYAWVDQVMNFDPETSTEVPILFYVTELIVCDGVTNVSNGLLFCGFSLNKVTLGNDITFIGEQAFNQCIGLTNIELPDNLRGIGEGAFIYCLGLQKLVIPNNVNEIGHSAFTGTGLTDIVIGNGVTTIGDNCFRLCSYLENVTIGSGVKIIGEEAFEQCPGLRKIIIPGNVTTIGDRAFMDCGGLEEVIIQDGVSIIGEGAFVRCENLTSIEIPDSITIIKESSFEECALNKIKILTTDAEKITIDVNIFSDDYHGNKTLPEGSKIYVLSEEMKTKLEGTYDSTKTTVEVVTLEQMNQL